MSKVSITLVIIVSAVLRMPGQTQAEIIGNNTSHTAAFTAIKQGMTNGNLDQIGVRARSEGVGQGWNYGVLGEAFGGSTEQFGVYGTSSVVGVYGASQGACVFGQVFGGSTSAFRVAIFGDVTADAGVGANGSGILQAGRFNGDVEYTGALLSPSDRKFKKNISNIGPVLNRVLKLGVVSYEYKSDQYDFLSKREQVGFVAQDVKEIFPNVVHQSAIPRKTGESTDQYNKGFSNKRYLAVDYVSLIPVLTKAIQELHQENQLLISRISKLESALISLAQE
ncbi:MAG: tail fiber domain-containing protein [Bacteroidota bacterium]